MPKVLHIMANPQHGGVESYFAQLCVALQHAGQHQHVVLLEDESLRGILIRGGVSLTEIPRNAYNIQTLKAAINEALHSFQPDIVQTWMHQATDSLPRGNYIHVGWLRGYQNLEFFRHCDHLVGLTRGIVQSIIEQGWPPERIHHLRPFARDEKASPVPRSQYTTPEHAPLLLALGVMHAYNAFDVALQALAQLPDHYLWLVGSGEVEEELHDFALQLGVDSRVRYLPWQDEKASLFAAADTIVVPSRHEPFGLIPVEAWALQKPLIISNASAPRVAAGHEVDALLFPVDDVDALVRAVKRLNSDAALREKLIENGYKHFQRDYTAELVVQQYRHFYSDVLKKGKMRSPGLSRVEEWKDRILAKFS
ncbi:MAG: glycosyltransferase [Alphaproteobacteria bacterium]|jgi:glycosyltransferase involved in cell wall biosynthesis|nr:glycosyltransferase [Alphaproteobacteria bacterium]